MHYISAENITKSYGINPLFSHISFHINEGDKIALIARNGVGKSTLLKILAGNETVDEGNLFINKNVTVALFEQEPKFDEEKNVLDNIFHINHPIINIIREYEMATDNNDEAKMIALTTTMDELGAWDFEVNVKQILSKLNIHHLQQPVKI
jgi:ATP-binding cassette subfamily F protein uup